MLLTGKEYLESIRDGRRVYVGSEQVDDVTTHPAFRNAAHSFAAIYDRKRAPENLSANMRSIGCLVRGANDASRGRPLH